VLLGAEREVDLVLRDVDERLERVVLELRLLLADRAGAKMIKAVRRRALSLSIAAPDSITAIGSRLWRATPVSTTPAAEAFPRERKGFDGRSRVPLRTSKLSS
jgi:hypothetical protein